MNGHVDMHFGPDFAERVLEAADRWVARRRLHRAAGASILCVGIAAAAVLLDFSVGPKLPAGDRNPVLAAAESPQRYRDPAGSAAEQESSSDALSWFFPDAEPLVRYTAEDAPDDSDTSAGALFADNE